MGFSWGQHVSVNSASILVRAITESLRIHSPRTCEYDDETLEYWVNIRTTGTMTKEDLEMLERKQEYQGEGGDELKFKSGFDVNGFDFSDDDSLIHKNTKDIEGDHHKSAPQTELFNP